MFDVHLTGDGGRFDTAIRRTLELACALADEGPTDEEIERVHALTLTFWARRLESADGRASALCDFEALGGIALGDEYLRRLLAVDTGAVRDVARRYLTPGGVSAVLYLPEGAHTGLREDAWPPA